jgi:hypothetical protein
MVVPEIVESATLADSITEQVEVVEQIPAEFTYNNVSMLSLDSLPAVDVTTGAGAESVQPSSEHDSSIITEPEFNSTTNFATNHTAHLNSVSGLQNGLISSIDDCSSFGGSVAGNTAINFSFTESEANSFAKLCPGEDVVETQSNDISVLTENSGEFSKEDQKSRMLNITLFEQQFKTPAAVVDKPLVNTELSDNQLIDMPLPTGKLILDTPQKKDLNDIMDMSIQVSGHATIIGKENQLPKVADLNLTLFEQQFATPAAKAAPVALNLPGPQTPSDRLIDVTVLDAHRKSSLGILPRHLMSSARLSFLSSMTTPDNDRSGTPSGTPFQDVNGSAVDSSATSLELLPRDLLNFSTQDLLTETTPKACDTMVSDRLEDN